VQLQAALQDNNSSESAQSMFRSLFADMHGLLESTSGNKTAYLRFFDWFFIEMEYHKTRSRRAASWSGVGKSL